MDARYTNIEGFLAPKWGNKISKWRDRFTPQNKENNRKYSLARYVIKRCFRLLKMQKAILQSPLFYPIKAQYRIIICMLFTV